MSPSELTNTIEQFIVYVHRNEANFTFTNPTEEKTCSINDLADNELRFRDMDLPKVSTEHDQSL